MQKSLAYLVIFGKLFASKLFNLCFSNLQQKQTMLRKKLKFSKKPLALTQNPVILIPMQTNTITANLTLPTNPVQLASALTGKTVHYTTKKDSSVTFDRERVFKVESVEDVSISQSTGDQYVNVKIIDPQDGGKEKYRNLIVDRISTVV
jgi:hypothetical protein